MSHQESVHNAKKELDLALQSLPETERYFMIEQIIFWLQEEKARTRERINYDSGAFELQEPLNFT